jgi:hypothetical protein
LTCILTGKSGVQEERGATMDFVQVAGCDDGVTCPKMFVKDKRTLVVQGRKADRETRGHLRLAEGEDAVEVPLDQLAEAARALEDLLQSR